MQDWAGSGYVLEPSAQTIVSSQLVPRVNLDPWPCLARERGYEKEKLSKDEAIIVLVVVASMGIHWLLL